MFNPDIPLEIFLQPGEHFFGGRETRIRTVLGSCVSLVFWHPHLLVGGMCHFMLPSRTRGAGNGLDGRYADEAVALMLNEIRAYGTQLREYQVKMFGGGNMFPTISRLGGNHVGVKNVLAARELMHKHGIDCFSEHVEGCGHRNLNFDVWSGQVALRHLPIAQPGAVKADVLSFNRADARACTHAAEQRGTELRERLVGGASAPEQPPLIGAKAPPTGCPRRSANPGYGLCENVGSVKLLTQPPTSP